MRILWCGDGTAAGGGLERRVWILGKNSAGNGLSSVISSPLVLPGGLFPKGAVWGYFWDDSFPHRQSGFLLYDNAGNYAVVYTKDQNNWEVSPLYTGLFGTGTNPGAVIAYRETVWPVTAYSPSKDIMCALVNQSATNAMYLYWSSSDGDTMEMGADADKVYMCDATASDYTNLSYQHGWNMNKTRFFFGGNGVTTYWTVDEKDFPTEPGGTGGWSGVSSATLQPASDWRVVNSPMRVRHTRRSFVNALMPKLYENLISIRRGEMRSDNDNAGVNESSTDLYFNNMCSPTDDYSVSANGAFDLEFEWGINQTSEDNCLFANVQAFGKYPMLAASFPPSHDTGSENSDTLLYLTVAPIVHGCRGITFYALDMALQSGPASQSSSAFFRAPAAMLNWGPSRDCEDNADMVSRVHDVVKMLTGKKGGPDFLNALVDHSSYEVLDDTEAFNALYTGSGYIPFPDDEYLNFIALTGGGDGSILLLISYDGDVEGCSAPLIVFPNKIASVYGSPECWGGYYWGWRSSVTGSNGMDQAVSYYATTEASEWYGTINEQRLSVFVGDMPPHSVCLLRIPRNRDDNRSSEATVSPGLQASHCSEGVVLQLTGVSDNCSLDLYDIAGRKVDGIEIPETEYYEVLLNADSYSAGIYFAVLREEADVVQMEKISIF
jgi:hypothetical protein